MKLLTWTLLILSSNASRLLRNCELFRLPQSKMQMICIWSSWCHCHLIISCSSKIQNGLRFWCRFTQVVLEQRPLKGCSSSSSTPCPENPEYRFKILSSKLGYSLLIILKLRRLCVRWGPSCSPKKGAEMSIVAKRLDGSRRHLARRWASVQATLC